MFLCVLTGWRMLCTVVAMSKAINEPLSARQMGVASIVLSVIGLAVGIICIIIVVVTQLIAVSVSSDHQSSYYDD